MQNWRDHASAYCYEGYAMLKTLWAIIREGRIELLEHVDLPEGTSMPPKMFLSCP